MIVDIMLNQKIALVWVANLLAPVDEFPFIVRPVIPIITAIENVAVSDDFDFLELPWDDQLLSFHNQDLTIYRKETGHLSAAQVNQPINTQSVGRWQNDLSAAEIDEFETVAGSALVDFGYKRS